ncbi:MAG: GNAT family N-acetyltransferase [Dehalococcoidia bacterium]|nr:GNAT family N-acetyltransferase [Dehalococcoidia bacterium]
MPNTPKRNPEAQTPRPGLLSATIPGMTTGEPIVRPATPADAAALAGLRWDFRAEYRAPVETHDAFLERCTAWMAPRLERSSPWHCWLAEAGDVPIASLWLCVLEKLPNPVGEPETHAYITSVYVAPAYRRHGLAPASCRPPWTSRPNPAAIPPSSGPRPAAAPSISASASPSATTSWKRSSPPAAKPELGPERSPAPPAALRAHRRAVMSQDPASLRFA